MPPILAIVGATATGKSALSVELCEALEGEVITADSRQVYKFMDIGTDKPDMAARRGIPHHLIDIVYPDESFTLAQYQEIAYATIDDTHRRGRLPVLAGGTPLYVNAVLEGWTIPRVEPDVALRQALEREAEEHGPALLHARLAKLDPEAAKGILPTNTRRIVRALEVIAATGEPISKQQRKSPPAYRLLVIGLHCERQELYRRIDLRVDEQIRRGLVEEVASLHERGYSFDLPSMTGLGYRQIGAYLQGRASLAEAVQRIKWDTHSFVRHQGNWFRRMTHAAWIDVTESPPTSRALELAREFMNSQAQTEDNPVEP